jgi:hypothetical protein
MAIDPQFPAVARTETKKFVNATGAGGTTAQTLLMMGGTIGGIIEALFLTSTDTVSREITIKLRIGTEDVFLDTIAIPAATSQRKVERVNLMSTSRWTELDPDNPKIVLATSREIIAYMETAVTAGAEVALICYFGEY